MRQLLLLLGVVLVVAGGLSSVAVAHQVSIEVETKLLLVLQPADESAPVDADLLEAAARTIERRVEALDIDGAKVWLSGGDQIVVELPGVNGDQADGIARTLTTTALLEIIDPQGQFLAEGTIVETTLGGPADGTPPESDIVYETVISGSDLSLAYVTSNQFGQDVVAFELTDEAGERFFQYTSNNIGKPLSIVIDKRVVSSPVVNSSIRNAGADRGNTAGRGRQPRGPAQQRSASGAVASGDEYGADRHSSTSCGNA